MATPGNVEWPGGSDQPDQSWKHAGTQKTAVVGDVQQHQLR